MKTLMLVEPVVFRGDPLFLAPHLTGWGLPMLQIHRQASSDPWILTSSRALCDLAKRHVPDIETRALPSWPLLAGADYDRHRYAAALFDQAIALQAQDGQGVLAPLFAALESIRETFAPELVIASAQNSVLPLVFPDARIVWIEQAPLPRRRGTARLSLDPCGHQQQSALQLGAERLKRHTVDPEHLVTIEALWRRMLAPADHEHNIHNELQRAIAERAADAPVALLVMQPSDWLTWEGTLGHACTPETILARWAAALPAGWIGIPMHHPDARLPEALEASLAAAPPNPRCGHGVVEPGCHRPHQRQTRRGGSQQPPFEPGFHQPAIPS